MSDRLELRLFRSNERAVRSWIAHPAVRAAVEARSAAALAILAPFGPEMRWLSEHIRAEFGAVSDGEFISHVAVTFLFAHWLNMAPAETRGEGWDPFAATPDGASRDIVGRGCWRRLLAEVMAELERANVPIDATTDDHNGPTLLLLSCALVAEIDWSAPAAQLAAELAIWPITGWDVYGRPLLPSLHVTSGDERDVAELARMYRKTALGERPLRRAGRPSGSQPAARLKLVARVKADPSMTDAVINALGRQLGVWAADSADDYDSIRKRVARIKKAAAN